MTPRVSVVVPVYNSESTVETLGERVRTALEPAGLDFELVLVDDGSQDGSWTAIRRMADADRRVRGLELARNYGQHNALLAGIRAARGEVIVTLDDDLQNAPEDIPRLVEKLDEGYDVVYGSETESGHSKTRSLGTRLTKYALRVAMGDVAHEDVGPFRAFRSRLRSAFSDYATPLVNIDVLLSWGTTRYASVPVPHSQRVEGKSTYNFRRLATHALNLLTGFSTRPLRVASLVGLFFTLFGFGIFVYAVVRWLIGGAVPGFPFLASIISIFAGVQLVTLGVIGEYLARMHLRIMDRPPYAVVEEAGER